MYWFGGHYPKEYMRRNEMATFRYGPSGGRGGYEFSDDALLEEGSKVVAVNIRSKRLVDAIQIVYRSANGAVHPLEFQGGPGGDLLPFPLDDDEFITGISGRYGVVVDSIRIHTNKQTSNRFGGDGGVSEYRYDAPDGAEIVGFFGRAADVIDAIGVIIRSR
jgi:hypothetical protein